MNNQDEFAATLAVELVEITMQKVNAMRVAGLVGFPDVDAVHACTLRQYRTALAAVRTGGTGDLPQPAAPVAAALTCKHCGNTIDPKFCHCGQYVVDHSWTDGHSPVPCGCHLAPEQDATPAASGEQPPMEKVVIGNEQSPMEKVLIGTVRLHELIEAGKGDSDEADAVRDSMDTPFVALTASERATTRMVSAAIRDNAPIHDNAPEPPTPAADALADGDANGSGRGWRYLVPGETMEHGDEFWALTPPEHWSPVRGFGRVVEPCEGRLYRRRITTAHADTRGDKPTVPAADALRDAALALYEAGRWVSPDVSAVQADAMWATLRDALGLPAGYATDRGVADAAVGFPGCGYNAVPLYAAPTAAVVTLTEAERGAVLSAVAHFGQIHWKCRSSHAHAAALRGLLARAAEGATAGPTLTDAEREAVRECADIARSQLWSAREGGDEETIARWMQRLARITGLLARSAKEER